MNKWSGDDTVILLRLTRAALFLLALTILCGTWFEFSVGKQSLGWSKTEGVVRQSEQKYLGRIRGTNANLTARDAVLLLAYEYRVEAKLETGHRIRLYDNRPVSDNEFSQLLKKYSVGSVHTVYYDQRNPSRSCLVPGPNYSNILALASVGTSSWLCSLVHFS